VQYAEFLSSVSGRIGRPREEAESLTHATLQVLADRISAGEAEDLAAQLPDELKSPLLAPPTADARSFGAEEFARQVASSAGIPESDALAGVAAVLVTLRDAVTPGEYDDVLAQLGREFADLIDAAR
jgi:uncharacterized protein (DUF2267 family)